MANYETVKAGIAGLLGGLGYSESSQAVDFTHASSREYENRYILKNLSGENQEDTIVDRFYDLQEWQVQIAFGKSAANDVIQYDAVHRAKDALLKVLDKPSNWTSFVAIMKYKSWEIVETDNYYVLDLRLSITDIYTY
jgi:hypothetical protein